MQQTMVLCPSCGAENRVDEGRAADATPVCGKCKQALNMKAPGFPIIATDASFETDVIQSGVPTLVDFWAEWCGPCRAFAPTLEKYAREMAGKVRVVKVNVDQARATASRYRIQSIPTLVLFRGVEAGRVSGALPMDHLKQFVGRYI